MPDRFGVHIVTPTLARTYKNGAFVQAYSHPVRSGSYTSIVALDTNGFHVDRIEWRSGGPAGTLLDADDFTDLSAWTVVQGSATINPASHLLIYGGEYSHWIRRTTPVGTDFVELIGVYFEPATGSIHWGMVSLNHNGTSAYGENGYRPLMREAPPHGVELPDGTPVNDPPGGLVLGYLTLN